jgi:hypothetical protein
MFVAAVAWVPKQRPAAPAIAEPPATIVAACWADEPGRPSEPLQVVQVVRIGAERNLKLARGAGPLYRWGIEANFLVEKHQGYHYEHAFALNWNAIKGYHYLMHLAHLFNALARVARHLRELYRELGVRGARAFIRSSCAAPWLDSERTRRLLGQPLQLQLE